MTGASPTITPVNFRSRDYGPRTIEEDADYGFRVLSGYLRGLGVESGAVRPLAGLRVMEIGPGHSMASPLLLACAGARVSIVDPYPPPWVTRYHARVTRALLERVVDQHPELDPAPLVTVGRAKAFVPDVVEVIARGIEDPALEADPFDAVVSNAALEHVTNVQVAAGNIARLTAPAGLGFHQIDFRDHRDFQRPLEYLTISREALARLIADTHAECGNGARSDEFLTAFARAGFEVTTYTTTMTADEAYLRDLRPRLHPDFAAIPEEQLRCLSGSVSLRRLGESPRSGRAAPSRPVATLSPRDRRRLALARRWDRLGVRARASRAAYLALRTVYRTVTRKGR